jgi:addiction module RelE/StbE family toxin
MTPIVWTDLAVADLEKLRIYIAHDSQQYANRFVEKLITSVEQLARFPEMGRIAPESPETNIREVIFQNYRIFYRPEANRILVLAVIHGGRDLSSLASKPWEIE